MKEIRYKFEQHICNGCRDKLMMAYKLKKSAILNLKGVDYRCVLWGVSKNGAINILSNSKLGDTGTLRIWILVQKKTSLK